MRKFFAVLLLVYSVTGYGQVFKCVENGRTIFSDRPCPTGEVQALDVGGVKHFDLAQVAVAGVRLGMTESEALGALADTLGIARDSVSIRRDRGGMKLVSLTLSVKHQDIAYKFVLLETGDRASATVVIAIEDYGRSIDIKARRREYIEKYGPPVSVQDSRVSKGEQLEWCPGHAVADASGGFSCRPAARTMMFFDGDWRGGLRLMESEVRFTKGYRLSQEQ
mgnify:CR=1 FL=1